MKPQGYIRVASVVPTVTVADPVANAANTIDMIDELEYEGVDLAVFPELSVSGYTCGDLFHQEVLLQASIEQLNKLSLYTTDKQIVVVVGVPVQCHAELYNCAAVIANGKVWGLVPKTYLPNYNEFYEKRLWTSGSTIYNEIDNNGLRLMPPGTLFELSGVKFGIEICEDLWAPLPPSTKMALGGAEIILNPSASNDLIGKYDYLRGLVKHQSAACLCGYVYAAAGFGESSTDLVFDGKAIIAENGTVLDEGERWCNEAQYAIADIDIEAIRRDRLHLGTFAECAHEELLKRNAIVKIELPGVEERERECECDNDCVRDCHGFYDHDFYRSVDPHPFVPSDPAAMQERCAEISNIQAAGLAQRLKVTGSKKLVVGISGGLDSTLALLVACRAFDRLGLDRSGIIGVTMPGFGTTGRTYANAMKLMDKLGVTIREISITKAVTQHFEDIGHDANKHDVTYENSQARERTQILMDLANKEGAMVLGTGDLSELALGWATYNGDHMSMYGVNASVPKTLVKYLVQWYALESSDSDLKAVLKDVIDTPISPELTPPDADGNIMQHTENLVGPYELHDFFLYYTLRYGFTPARIFYLAKQAFCVAEESLQRRVMPVGYYNPETIKKWMRVFYRRFFNQQFKRSCLPDGPKVGSVCLSPRGDWRMPSDASAELWLKEVERL